MNETNQFGYAEGGEGVAAPPSGPITPATYKFSPDEMRVLQECNQESFFKRSLPIGTALGFGAFAAIQKGYFKPSPRFGVFPKVTLAVVAGYFIGKLSYQQACAEKLMNLPGSYIGQLLRERRDGRAGPTSMPPQSPSMFGASQGDIYSDAGPGNSLDLDTDRPLFNDDSYRSGSDSGRTDTLTPPSQSSLSYDELRRRNRSQHAEARQDPYKVDPNAMPPIYRKPAPSQPITPTNKYGDSME